MATSNVSLMSVIIVVKNDRGIASTLEQVAKQKTDVPFETIVVDASLPEALADIRMSYPNVIWDQYPYSQQRTTPQQRNRGIELAQGDVIVFIDANCQPVEGWLQSMSDHIRKGKMIVTGPVKDLSPRNLVHYSPEHEKGKYIDVCTTINVAISRTVIDDVGLFDTNFRFGQDIDFFWRAADKGYRIFYEPRAGIGHDWGERKEQFGRAFQYGRARAHLYKKHWRQHYKQLIREPHVWAYPLFIIGLVIVPFFPAYLLILLIPILKNIKHNPVGLIAHHFAYGIGVIVGACTLWPV